MTDEMKPCPECAEQVKAQAFLCRYCKYDFRTGTSGKVAPSIRPAPKKKGFPVWAIVLIAGAGCCLVVPVVAAIAIPGMLQAQRESNERSAVASLRTLVTAQTEFRSNDRDENGVRDFWTGDVAGLYCMTDSEDRPLHLIGFGLAIADAEPLGAGSVGGRYSSFGSTVPIKDAGYLFLAMEIDPDGVPYARETDDTMGAVHNEFGFAFCAFPETVGTGGHSTFIINQDGTVYKADTGGEPIYEWPSPDDLRINWAEVP